MSSDTDHPRQRTVAELLAQHGDVNATGRRRRRRESDGSDEGAAAPVGLSAPAVPDWPAPTREPVSPAQPGSGGRRRADREPEAWEPRRAPEPQARDSGPQWGSSEWDAQPAPRQNREREQRGWEPEPAAPEPRAWDSGPQAWEGRPSAAAAGPVRDRPTEHIPRIRDEAPPSDVSLTSPIQAHRRPGGDTRGAEGYQAEGYDSDGYDLDDEDAGPPTVIGAAPVGAEAWHQERTSGRRGGAPVDDDGGPPTEAAAPIDFGDHPAGLGGRRFDDSVSDGFEDFYGGGQEPPPPPVHRPERARNDRRRFGGGEPARDAVTDSGESEPVEDEKPRARSRLGGMVGDSAGQAWAAVLAQWIAGAVGGAALWVAFRFLWRSLPVVALAAAVLVTVGLVVVVRALLRNDDMRTTLFAVLVGLLLTVSPAILVLLGR